MRKLVLGVSGWVVLAGSVSGKPPGPVVSPLVEGREPPPVVREHYEVAGIGRELPYASPDEPPQKFDAAWIEWLKLLMDGDFTIPLGTVPMPGEE
jgi:hypothetical protein